MSKFILASAIVLLTACTGETKPASTSDSTAVATDSAAVVADSSVAVADTSVTSTTTVIDTVKR